MLVAYEVGSGEAVEPVDAMQEIEKGVERILAQYSDLTNDEVLENTPRRVARALTETLSGWRQDPEEILSRTFSTDRDDMVVVTSIPVCSMCEHHMMPFTGYAHVGYIPDGKLLGVSKVARLVECYARRLQLQERLTAQVADAIMSHLEPKGVGVIIVAEHTCMTTRGVNRPGTKTVTSAMRGLFRDDEKTRAEFTALLGVRA